MRLFALLLLPAALVAGQARLCPHGRVSGNRGGPVAGFRTLDGGGAQPAAGGVELAALGAGLARRNRAGRWQRLAAGAELPDGDRGLLAAVHRPARDPAVARSRPGLFHRRGGRPRLPDPGPARRASHCHSRRPHPRGGRGTVEPHLGARGSRAVFLPSGRIGPARRPDGARRAGQSGALLPQPGNRPDGTGPLERRARPDARRLHLRRPRAGALRPGGSGRCRHMGADRGSRPGLEAQNPAGLDSFPERPVALVRRPGLHLGERRRMGLAAVSLRPLAAQDESRLDLGARAKRRLQARRRVLAARSAARPDGGRWHPANSGFRNRPLRPCRSSSWTRTPRMPRFSRMPPRSTRRDSPRARRSHYGPWRSPPLFRRPRSPPQSSRCSAPS